MKTYDRYLFETYDQHHCDSYCSNYCEVCDLDYCADQGHECLLDEFEDLEEQDECNLTK